MEPVSSLMHAQQPLVRLSITKWKTFQHNKECEFELNTAVNMKIPVF